MKKTENLRMVGGGRERKPKLFWKMDMVTMFCKIKISIHRRIEDRGFLTGMGPNTGGTWRPLVLC